MINVERPIPEKLIKLDLIYFCLLCYNKRAMMALNRSPEFKSSNPKPSAAELFGT